MAAQQAAEQDAEMTQPDQGLKARLDALRAKATDDNLADEGHHFRDGMGYTDLTQCNHGDCGYFCNRGDGPLIAALWNALRANQLITLSDHEATVKAAVDGHGFRIYLDLDGVMADFDAHFPAEFGLDHKSMADDDMWAKINAHQSYFEDMPLCDGAADFFADIQHLKPIILTACPRTNYAHVAGQKRRWVHKHLGAGVTVLPVMGGHNKHIFMHAPGDILIDDYEKNCAPWRKSGGVAILHTSFDATRSELRAAIRARANGGE